MNLKMLDLPSTFVLGYTRGPSVLSSTKSSLLKHVAKNSENLMTPIQFKRFQKLNIYNDKQYGHLFENNPVTVNECPILTTDIVYIMLRINLVDLAYNYLRRGIMITSFSL